LSSTEAPPEAGDTDAPDGDAVEVDEARESLLESLRGELGDAVAASHIRPGDDLWVRVDNAAWADAARFLREGEGFAYLSFVSAIDWMPSPFGRDMDSQVDLALTGETDDDDEPQVVEQGIGGGDTRFQVFARVNDVVGMRSLTLKADVADDDPRIESWVPIYPGASWHERECWEMYGITFDGHPGLRHIYLPGEFEGNPLRKDYPLLARRVKPWPGIVDVEGMPGSDDEEADS